MHAALTARRHHAEAQRDWAMCAAVLAKHHFWDMRNLNCWVYWSESDLHTVRDHFLSDPQ